jgi:hypothetical protein
MKEPNRVIADLAAAIMCEKCGARAESVEVWRDYSNDRIYFRASCHGEEDTAWLPVLDVFRDDIAIAVVAFRTPQIAGR